jgi:HNH endonuclease
MKCSHRGSRNFPTFSVSFQPKQVPSCSHHPLGKWKGSVGGSHWSLGVLALVENDEREWPKEGFSDPLDSRYMAVGQRKKRDWFERGAAAYAAVRAERHGEPIYPCPTCFTPFTVDAVADGRLSSEHVPPESVGGHDLVLTCKRCNNSAGTKLDADAAVKELVRSAIAGTHEHRERVKAAIGDLCVNAEVHLSGGRYSLVVPHHVNKPSTAENVKAVARPGTSITVQYRRFSELGAKISWFRAGYLALFAAAGYRFALDPAIEIVRRQILECDERRMVTFTSEVSDDIALSVHRILRVLAPDWAWRLGSGIRSLLPAFPVSRRHGLLRPNGDLREHRHAVHDYVRIRRQAQRADVRACGIAWRSII